MIEPLEIPTGYTPGPWKLTWWGNERYPYPLSVHTDENWICRDGTVARRADAALIALAPQMAERIASLTAENERLREALRPFARLATFYSDDTADDCFAEEIVPYVEDLRRARAALKYPGEPGSDD